MAAMVMLITTLNTILWGALVSREGHFTFKGKKLNKEEAYIGAGVGVAASWLIWWPLIPILGLGCGFLWAWAGAEGTSKNWRKLLIGAILALLGAISRLSWIPLLTFLCLWGATSLGYGIPDETDSGSAIGKFWFKRLTNPRSIIGNFWYKIFKEKIMLVNIFTRATVGLCYGLALIPLMF